MTKLINKDAPNCKCGKAFTPQTAREWVIVGGIIAQGYGPRCVDCAKACIDNLERHEINP
jgi:hypothetical protein